MTAHAASLPRRPLGRTGLNVSILGFGAAPVGLLKVEQERVALILNTLLDHGVNFIDTAASYAGSEEAIGQAVSHRRGEFVLLSKCGQAFPDLPGPAWSAQVITATVERALRRLRTDHLDVMLLHSCDLATLQKGEALGALVKAREAGKVRHVGYSGDNEAAVYAAGLADIAVLETSINIVDQANIDRALPAARANNVGVVAKRPIANAAWKPVSAQPGFYQDYAKPYHERFSAMGLKLEDFAAENIVDWPELALRFTLSQPGVTTAIVGTTKPDNALHNIQIAGRPALSDAAVRRIRTAFDLARSGQDWPGLT